MIDANPFWIGYFYLLLILGNNYEMEISENIERCYIEMKGY